MPFFLLPPYALPPPAMAFCYRDSAPRNLYDLDLGPQAFGSGRQGDIAGHGYFYFPFQFYVHVHATYSTYLCSMFIQNLTHAAWTCGHAVGT
jgi:hypothetical protein